MIRKLPALPTLLVLAAVGLMLRLGVWQLHRAKEHAAELARYQRSAKLPPITYPTVPIKKADLPLYRQATGNCLKVVNRRTSTGEDRTGEPGFVIILDCATGAEGPGMSVEVGWSKNPNAKTSWAGGLVSGVIVPDDKTGMRLVAASAAPGLEPSVPPAPSVKVSPARNRGYAATWFALAVAGLLVYGFAIAKRLREERAR